MFLGGFKLYHDDCPIVNRCVKFGTDVISYPGHHYKKNNVEFTSTFCKFRDADKGLQRKFLSDLRKDPECKKLDVWGDNFFYEYSLGTHGEHVMLYFNLSLMFTRPTINSRDGHEYWEIAATNKEIITEFFDNLKKHMTTAEIIYIREDNDIDFVFPLATRKLSKTQKKVLKIALEKNYYSFPRKADLAEIAKECGTSIPTVQEHLRKAEAKILNERLIL
ncbi:MAG: helix-turn-helix domain-containing protein [Candidatus Diapherotrites archaeon]